MSDSQDSSEEWITVEQAADLLDVSTRQANRYGTDPNPRVRVRKAGRRYLYHRGDVEALAADLGVIHRLDETSSRASNAKGEVVPASEALARVEHVQEQLNAAIRRIGYYEGRIEELEKQTGNTEAIRQQLIEAEKQIAALAAERDTLREMLRQERPRPWWKRFF